MRRAVGCRDSETPTALWGAAIKRVTLAHSGQRERGPDPLPIPVGLPGWIPRWAVSSRVGRAVCPASGRCPGRWRSSHRAELQALALEWKAWAVSLPAAGKGRGGSRWGLPTKSKLTTMTLLPLQHGHSLAPDRPLLGSLESRRGIGKRDGALRPTSDSNFVLEVGHSVLVGSSDCDA